MHLAPHVSLTGTLARGPDGAGSVFHTLRLMRELVQAGRVDPAIIQAATSIIWLTPEKDDAHQARALFEWVRDSVRYVRDVHEVETLALPRITLARRAGDCDDQTVLLASMLEAVGIPTRFVMGAYNSEQFEHVYLQCFVAGEWIDCDATEREPFGYAPPDPVRLFIERG